jgi:hypothetical protein
MDDLFEDERQFKAPIPFNQIAAALTKILQKYCSWNIFIENSMLLFFQAKHTLCMQNTDY